MHILLIIAGIALVAVAMVYALSTPGVFQPVALIAAAFGGFLVGRGLARTILEDR
jgi:uncharacterized membrane-anchored protein YitT (DUF2179 family)